VLYGTVLYVIVHWGRAVKGLHTPTMVVKLSSQNDNVRALLGHLRACDAHGQPNVSLRCTAEEKEKGAMERASGCADTGMHQLHVIIHWLSLKPTLCSFDCVYAVWTAYST